MVIEAQIGNEELLNLGKTAFLCSRQVPASTVLKCYDRAIAQREACNCVISGFHSTIEKDVHDLLKGGNHHCSISKSLKQQIEPVFKIPMEEGTLLIVMPFRDDVKRVAGKQQW